MDPRLLPLNAVLALLKKDGGWFHNLADQGFRLHHIELKAQTPEGLVVADVVIYRQDPDLVVLCEGKSGRNVDEDQAKKYASADGASLRRGGSLPVAVAYDDVPVCPLFVVMHDARTDVEDALGRLEIAAPVLSIGRGLAHLNGPCPEGLEPFFAESASGRPRRWPPARVRVDHQSPLNEVVELLAQQIVAAQARHQPVLTLEDAGAGIYREWPALSLSGRRELEKKLKACAKHLADSSLKGTIRLQPGSNHAPAAILIERTPADADVRGMPQAWQGQARHMAADLGRGGGPPPEVERQLSLDDLDLGEAEEPEA